MSCSCVNSADLFCYVCGEVMLASQRRSITPLIKKMYHLYFGYKLGDQDKKWALHIVCKSCAVCLGGWIIVREWRCHLPFQWCGGNPQTTAMTAAFT